MPMRSGVLHTVIHQWAAAACIKVRNQRAGGFGADVVGARDAKERRDGVHRVALQTYKLSRFGSQLYFLP